MKYSILYHYIFVTLFPASGTGYIHFHKCLKNHTFGGYCEMNTIRKVSFDYAINYLVKHEMKMEKSPGCSDMFESVKRRTEW